MPAKKSDTIYRVICDVPSSALTTVMQVIEGAARIVKVEPVGESSPAKTARYVGGKRNKGISGMDLFLKTLREIKVPATEHALRLAFESHGFSPNSLGPILSRALKAKKVFLDGEGRVRLDGEGRVRLGKTGK